MTKNKIILSVLLMFAFVSVCCFSASQVNTSVEVEVKDKEAQNDVSVSVLSTPKSSAYDVEELWNCTSDETVNAVAVSANGKYTVVGTDLPIIVRGTDYSINTVFFYNNTDHDGHPMWHFNTNEDVHSVAISADGYYMAVAGTEKAYVFNRTEPTAGKDKIPQWCINWSSSDAFTSIDISADGEYIVMGIYDISGWNEGKVILCNSTFSRDSGTGMGDMAPKIRWLNETECKVNDVAISADGKYVVAGTSNSIEVRGVDVGDTIFYYNNTDEDTINKTHAPEWSYDTEDTLGSVAISATDELIADHYYVVAGSSVSGYAYLLNGTKEAGEPKIPIWEWAPGAERVNSVDISADGEDVVIGYGNLVTGGYVRLFTNTPFLPKGNPYLWEYETGGAVNSVSITADGEYIVAGTDFPRIRAIDNQNTAFLFNNSGYTAGSEHAPEWNLTATLDDDVNSVSISSWGNYIAIGGEYDLESEGRVYMFHHDRPIPPVVRLLLSALDDDDDEAEAAIPFGAYYLIFVGIAIVSLILVQKRKVILSKK